MRDARSSHLDRLAALPALALIVYALLTLPAGGSARDPIPTIAGQVYAGAGRGQAIVVDREHLQVRAPDTFEPARKDSETDTSALPSLATVQRAFLAVGAPREAAHSVPTISRYRTHNPRDPPSRAA